MKTITTSIPGKIILSGEHAVVYGCPAIALAINRYVEVEAAFDEKPELIVDIANFNEQIAFPNHNLATVLAEIRQRYKEFQAGERSIREVLDDPYQLIHFVFAQLHERAPQLADLGIYLKINSHIPIGSGLGSSAAIILAIYDALVPLLNITITESELFTLALEAENLQHGYSSGLDLRICHYGGALIYENNKVTRLTIPDFTFYLVDTGHPESTTGECVSAVKSYFENDEIKQQFSNVTHKMIDALKQANISELIDSVRINSRLLENIGVVPTRVRHFIHAIEAAGGAAKICGAGSIVGDNAGMLLVITERNDPQTICDYYGYELLEVKMHKAKNMILLDF
jgi:mevalonate kinase